MWLIMGGLIAGGLVLFLIMKSKKSQSQNGYSRQPQVEYAPQETFEEPQVQSQPQIQQSPPPVEPKSTSDYLSNIMGKQGHSDLPPTIQELKRRSL
jgi:hypothetical protein